MMRRFAESVLDVRFKGTRNYVHGTDILNAITSLLGATHGFVEEIIFRRPFRSLPVIKERTPTTHHFQPNCSVAWHGELGQSQLFDLHESGQSIDRRYQYYEELALQQFLYDESGGIGKGHHEFTFIENAVAMTKAVNMARYRPVDEQWIFSRGRFSGPFPTSWSQIRITSRGIASQRVSDNKISVDGDLMGSLLFMVGKL